MPPSLAATVTAPVNILVEDYDDAGTITQKPPGQASYTVAANGALSFSGGAGGNVPAGFLISQNKAFWVSTGNSPNFGWLKPQTGGPFSNASIAGTYAGGTLPPLDYTNGKNEADVVSADGNGTFTFNGDSSNSSGLSQKLGLIGNYSIASNGRGTISGGSAVIYVISPTKWLVLQPKTDADVGVFGH